MAVGRSPGKKRRKRILILFVFARQGRKRGREMFEAFSHLSYKKGERKQLTKPSLSFWPGGGGGRPGKSFKFQKGKRSCALWKHKRDVERGGNSSTKEGKGEEAIFTYPEIAVEESKRARPEPILFHWKKKRKVIFVVLFVRTKTPKKKKSGGGRLRGFRKKDLAPKRGGDKTDCFKTILVERKGGKRRKRKRGDVPPDNSLLQKKKEKKALFLVMSKEGEKRGGEST